jgi:cyclase
MLARRLIACLDTRDDAVVKGVRFEQLRRVGDPAALARRYSDAGIDEVVVLDVSATIEARQARTATVAAVAAAITIPLTVGGGIRSEEDGRAVMDAGADKVSLNTAALREPGVITRLAGVYGSQAVVVAIDARRHERGYVVASRSGTTPEGTDPVTWAREAVDRGAGEILLTSIDRDGTRSGFDCELTAAVASAVPVPVIASGGAGTFQHFADVFTAGRADAALAASIFHMDDESVATLKAWLAGRNIPVRAVR